MDDLNDLSARFILVVDKQPSFIDYQVASLLGGRLETISALGQAGAISLFDTAPAPSLLELGSVEDVKKCAQQLKKLDVGELEQRVGAGLAITTTVSRTYTRGLEKAVSDLGGRVVLARKGAKDKTNPAQTMLAELNLKSEVKQFLLDYAGVSYELITPILSSLSKLPRDKQIRLSVESVDARLPKPPGALEPWEVEGPLLKGNVFDTISTYRRIRLHNHHLVVLAILKGKLQRAFRVSALLDGGVRKLPDIAEALGEPNNYPLRLSYDLARRLDTDTLAKALQTVLEAEKDCKGASRVAHDVVMETMLVELAGLLGGR